MQTAADIIKFYDGAEKVATAIAADHDAPADGVYRRWCFAAWIAPPSIASGVGQLTEQVFCCVEFAFTTTRPEVRRTRKFTIFHPDGQEIWPSGQMRIMTVEDPDGPGRVGRLGFFLHVGNRIAESYGVLAGWRDRNLVRALQQAESALDERGAVPTIWDEAWMEDYRGADDLGYWAA